MSNNDKGISGVAGGDLEEEITGVLLQNYRISHSPQILVDPLCSAVGWAIDSGNVDILNNSIGFKEPYITNYSMTLLREVYRLAYRANIITVNARGNNGDTEEEEPATIRDEYGISVGASGTDGHIATLGLNLGGPGDDQNYSKYGLEMDMLAPGVNPLLQKTPSYLSDTGYQKFGATSAAAPQVAGLVAWVLNNAPSPLAVEDIERLIEYSAQDKSEESYEEYLGYDEHSGWGLIDAGATLDLLNKSKVIRAQLIGADEEFVNELDGISCDSYLGCLVDLNWPDPDTSVSTGQHLARVYRYIANFSYNVCQELGVIFQAFPDTAKLPFWVLNSLSPYFGSATADTLGVGYLELDPWEDSRFQNMTWDSCSLSGQIVGYKYEFLTYENGVVTDSTFLPLTEDEDFFFSLLVKADTINLPDTILLEDLVSVHEVDDKALQPLLIWPNPFDHQIWVQVPQGLDQNGVFQVFDLRGRVVVQQDYFPTGLSGPISIPATLWCPGVYFLRFISPPHLLSAKAIKF